jgi:hypothetical protein
MISLSAATAGTLQIAAMMAAHATTRFMMR